jgi:hypothetical protein
MPIPPVSWDDVKTHTHTHPSLLKTGQRELRTTPSRLLTPSHPLLETEVYIHVDTSSADSVLQLKTTRVCVQFLVITIPKDAKILEPLGTSQSFSNVQNLT